MRPWPPRPSPSGQSLRASATHKPLSEQSIPRATPSSDARATPGQMRYRRRPATKAAGPAPIAPARTASAACRSPPYWYARSRPVGSFPIRVTPAARTIAAPGERRAIDGLQRRRVRIAGWKAPRRTRRPPSRTCTQSAVARAGKTISAPDARPRRAADRASETQRGRESATPQRHRASYRDRPRRRRCWRCAPA